jgi:septum formation protein
MQQLGIPFKLVDTGHTGETYPPGLKEEEVAVYLAEHKSDAYTSPIAEKQVLLTADTIVWHRGKELGKPSGEMEAIEMLTDLSGSAHYVYTGVCLRSARARRTFFSATRVTFSELEPGDIEYYVQTFRPFDKAGSYGIQEWIGYIAVEAIEGSYFNVMGLPVQKLYSELKRFIADTENF